MRFMSEPIISIQHLRKEFQGAKHKVEAISDISIDIMPGEIYGIIGLSGAGKSTLVRCINYLEQPTSGEVVFDGRKMSSLSPKELRSVRQEMGMIFQQFQLLQQRTALRNVTFPLEIRGVKRAEAEKRARQRFVGLLDQGWTMMQAFEAVHATELAQLAAQSAAQQAQQSTVQAIRAGQGRPVENGAGQRTGNPSRPDPSKFTDKEMDEYIRRSKNGERISF